MCIFLPVAMVLSMLSVWICRDHLALRDLPGFLEGKWTSQFEGHYTESLYTYKPSLNFWTAMTYAAFREGKEGVLVGKDGWLFTKEEFDYQKDRSEALAENIKFVKAVHDHLAENNIKLLVVPVPAKARVYENHLGRFEYPEYKKSIYSSFMADLEKSGIAVSDTLAAMRQYEGDGLFLRTDTHWTPEGAEVAAQAAARTIKIAYPDSNFKETTYVTVPGQKEEHFGDLMRYVPVGPFLPATSELKPDSLQVFETVERDSADEASLENNLFSTDVPDVTLVGTSYSANPKWNFAGYLKESLHTDVLNVAKDGLGPFETMKTYLTNEAFKETPPKIVVWEIPERYLTVKYDLRTDFYPYKGA